MQIFLKQLETGKTRTLKIGWSWTLFFFSSLYGIPLFLRGLKSWGWLMLSVGVFTAFHNLSSPVGVSFLDHALLAFFTVSAIFFGIKGNELTLKHYVKNGWVFADDQSTDGNFAREVLGLPSEKQQTLHHHSARGMDKHESKDFVGAILDYSAALQIDPDNDTVLSLRGVAKLDSLDFLGAIDDFTQALKINSVRAEYYCNRGRAYLHTEEYDKAIQDQTMAIQLDPNYDEAYYYRGDAHFGLQKYKEATADYTMVIQITPLSTRAYYGRGMSRLLFGDKQNALDDLKRAQQSSNRILADMATKALETLGSIDFSGRGLT